MIRWPMLFVVLGLVGAMVAYDRVSPIPPRPEVVEATSENVNPAISDPPRINAAWFCPIGSSSQDGFADHQLDIANVSPEPAVAVISILTEEGPGPGTRVQIEPYDVQHIRLSDYQASDVAGAVVEVVGGQGLVGHSVTTEAGLAEGPCATEVSSEWYFANGRTEADSAQYLALMNPFPEAAVYDLQVTSPVRPRSRPGQYVPARSVKLVRLDEFLTREENTATKIVTQQGRLVVERLQVVDGVMGPAGASLQLGVTAPAEQWYLTAGRVTADGGNVITVYNPAPIGLEILREAGEVGAENVDEAFELDEANTATVNIQLWPTNPTDRTLYGITAIEREIRPGGLEVIDLAAQAERFGFPLPYELSVYVESTNGNRVVAERWLAGRPFESAIRLDDESGDGDETAMEDASAEEGAAEEGETEDGAEEATAEDDAEREGAADGDAATEQGGDSEGGASEDGDSEGDFDVPTVDPGAELLPQPLAVDGLGTSRGSQMLSTRWLIPWIRVADDSTLIAIMSPTEATVEIRTLVNGSLGEPVGALVSAEGRVIVPIELPPGALAGLAVQVVSDQPIAVEGVVVDDESLGVVAAIPTVE